MSNEKTGADIYAEKLEEINKCYIEDCTGIKNTIGYKLVADISKAVHNLVKGTFDKIEGAIKEHEAERARQASYFKTMTVAQATLIAISGEGLLTDAGCPESDNLNKEVKELGDSCPQLGTGFASSVINLKDLIEKVLGSEDIITEYYTVSKSEMVREWKGYETGWDERVEIKSDTDVPSVINASDIMKSQLVVPIITGIADTMEVLKSADKLKMAAPLIKLQKFITAIDPLKMKGDNG